MPDSLEVDSVGISDSVELVLEVLLGWSVDLEWNPRAFGLLGFISFLKDLFSLSLGWTELGVGLSGLENDCLEVGSVSFTCSDLLSLEFLLED